MAREWLTEAWLRVKTLAMRKKLEYLHGNIKKLAFREALALP